MVCMDKLEIAGYRNCEENEEKEKERKASG